MEQTTIEHLSEWADEPASCRVMNRLPTYQPDSIITSLKQRSHRHGAVSEQRQAVVDIHDQCCKFPQVPRSEADNFGEGPGTFCQFFFNFMFMIWDSRQEDLQLFWLSFKHCSRSTTEVEWWASGMPWVVLPCQWEQRWFWMHFSRQTWKNGCLTHSLKSKFHSCHALWQHMCEHI